MSQHTPTVLEIDRKLRDDFRRRVKDFGVSAEVTDPLLAVLFRTVAQQIDQVYSDTGLLRQSLLRELMSGLQVQQYLARPAQTVVRLITDAAEPKILRAGTELSALASTGERLNFGIDATFEISQARIAFALSYQDQALRLLSGVEMSDAMHAFRPSSEATPIGLGQQPSLFLAIENLPPSMLSRHGVFFELGPGTYALQAALCREPWWIFGEEGELSGSGLMRPHRINSGVYQLDWQQNGPESSAATDTPLPEIPDGFYSGRQFLFPLMQESQPLLCRCPRLLEAALARICGRDVESLLQTPRLWIRIPMPPGVPAIHHAVNNILLHTMTASNVFCRNQTVNFDRDGISIPVVREGGTAEFLVAPLSVTGTGNEPYEIGSRPQRSTTSGWYELHNNRLTLHPGYNNDGTRHTAANVRLWLTNGELANRVGPGDISGFANSASLYHIRVAPFTAASGGSNGEDYASEERRFSEALLTRGRIVTRKDMEAAALAIDRRILSAETRSGIERRPEGLRRVERLQLFLDSAAFSKFEIELPLLQSQVERSLRSRLVHGMELEVSFTWK
ncbi:MAG TPA: hypothetical protein VK608_15970 [Edaphobacter sp.]|nr:hypothetical protein [Edaphobacter sp.]